MKNYLKNKYFASFFLGLISALSFAPTHFLFAAIIGFSGLFLLLNNCQNKKESFWIGFSFGFGYFLLGLYWISISLFTDLSKFGWLLPFSITLIPAALACYIGLIGLATFVIPAQAGISGVARDPSLRWDDGGRNKITKFLLFTIIWVIFEWLRSTLFTGFPWNLIGYNLGFSDSLIQIASIGGIYLLSFISIIICTSPALFFTLQNNKLKFHHQKINFLIAALILILIGSVYGYGNHRLKNSVNELVENGNLRLVQPGIKQGDKWRPDSHYESFMENVHLTNSKTLEKINYVIWSESAISYIISNDSDELLSQIAKATPQNGYLISGGLRAEFADNHQIKKIWNSVFAIDAHKKIVGFYDKNHLVPFGEYIPLQSFFPFISKITEGAIGFSSGNGPQTLKPNNNLPSFGPLVCYEIIFTSNIINKNNRPQFLVNITNDAWFGNSSGPYQHLDMAKIRAVEYGIPIARVANTGISALIDPYGRIVAKLNLNEKGILDVKLMKNLPETFYGKYF